jgi:ParB-like chromosome segregation protein Spo0J
MTKKEKILTQCKAAFSALYELEGSELIDTINNIRQELSVYSPFKSEPVDCIVWVSQDSIVANDYNPNSVAPPEMRLLQESILQDGYTQPIVSWKRDEVFEVVDGFHRNRVGRECKEVARRIKGYLPLTVINSDREDLGDRMASTIRHNRARGKHNVDSMSDIVVELKKRNWSDEKISKNLGMEPDEILRLCQISGLTEMFKDVNFSEAWDVPSTGVDDEEVISEDEIE